ncbi:hypothetical protein AB0E66_22320 [Streptomyces sp. NPDC033753]|uniref:hypothetical protein n=1 Tax=Streptomyces sp. NPDC033753 TaxID=3155128 RepID=UPI0033D2F6BB
MFAGREFGDGLSGEVGVGLGEVVEEVLTVGEQVGDAFAEGGGVPAAPGGERYAGAAGDVDFVEDGAAAGDHGPSSEGCCAAGGRCRVVVRAVSSRPRGYGYEAGSVPGRF